MHFLERAMKTIDLTAQLLPGVIMIVAGVGVAVGGLTGVLWQ